MAFSFLNTIYNEEKIQSLADNERDFLLLNGGSFRLRSDTSKDRLQHAPFFLFPSFVSEQNFNLAIKIQPIISKLLVKVANDREFLRDSLKGVLEVDEFTSRLFSIYEESCDHKHKQYVKFGLLRSDYFQSESVNCASPSLSQVEVNSIASGWSGMSVVSSLMHRYALSEIGEVDKLKNLPDNNSLTDIAKAMLHAWSLYNNSSAAVLFVVEDRAINICDQRFHEFELCRLQPGIKVLRRSFLQLIEHALVDGNKRLFVDDYEVALVYYRVGYSPDHYPSEEHWHVRRLIELSAAIKCPCIGLHLSGTKKIQQVLSKRNVLESFKLSTNEIDLLMSTLTDLYSLEMTPEGDETLRLALEAPHDFVLKPQREGGGNNVYGEEVGRVLRETGHERRRAEYVLMRRIHPEVQSNFLLRPGCDVPERVQSVFELGIFGYVISEGSEILANDCCGFTLRSKPSHVLEGGIAAGFGAMDSPYLV